jgi:hypothetical protein
MSVTLGGCPLSISIFLLVDDVPNTIQSFTKPIITPSLFIFEHFTTHPTPQSVMRGQEGDFHNLASRKNHHPPSSPKLNLLIKRFLEAPSPIATLFNALGQSKVIIKPQ